MPSEPHQKLNAFTEKRQLIAEHAIHALQSSIAYEDDGFGGYRLPNGWERLPSVSDRSGLFIAIFRHLEAKELVLAFRGTEFFSIKDWTQNLLKAQGRAAYSSAMDAIARANCGICAVVFTGHSMGGALAIQLSHRIPNVDAVAFNPSPRIGLKRSGFANYRVVFRERSEILAPLRGNPSRTDGWQLTYNVLLDFERGFVGTNVFKQHGIDTMATGMLMLAAGWSEDVRSLRDRNCIDHL